MIILHDDQSRLGVEQYWWCASCDTVTQRTTLDGAEAFCCVVVSGDSATEQREDDEWAADRTASEPAPVVPQRPHQWPDVLRGMSRQGEGKRSCLFTASVDLTRSQRQIQFLSMCVTGCLHGTIVLVGPTSRMKRLHVPIVGPTGRPDPGYVRLVSQTSRTDRSDRL